MELSRYINTLRNSLQSSAAPAGDDVAEAAKLLAQSLEPAAKLSLLEAMSAAADEITLALETASVDARLRGQEIEFVVSSVNQDELSQEPSTPDQPPTDQPDDVARITLRLPESIKESVDKAARAQNISVNGWLVQAIANALNAPSGNSLAPNTSRRNRSFRGFARS